MVKDTTLLHFEHLCYCDTHSVVHVNVHNLHHYATAPQQLDNIWHGGSTIIFGQTNHEYMHDSAQSEA